MKSNRQYSFVAILFIASCAVLTALPAQNAHANTAWAASTASTPANTAPAPDITQALDKPRLWGKHRLVVYGFNIYDARLWASEGFQAQDYEREPFALELHYLRNFSGNMIAERSLKEMRKLGTVSDEKAKAWLAEMRQTFPDIKKGDHLIGIHQPDGSARFVLNGKPIGEMRDAEFTRLFFGIWLSPQSSEPKMRRDLIGAAAPRGPR